MMRRMATALVAVTLALVLAACGGLPTSGPVNAGQPITDDDTSDDVVFLPDGPVQDATPQQIVQGFIAAGSGPRGNWATAKEFLAPGYTDWDPRAGVIVYGSGDRSLEQVSDGEFVVSVTPVATVDATGEMTTPGEADPGEIALPFSLAQQSDGQWRITQAPPGIALDRNVFGVVYRTYALQFFDPSWTYLVPDERWFPRLYARTNIAEALVDGGPSPWLDGAVNTAFTDGARLAVATVPVTTSNVAEVSLEDGALGLDRTVLDRMQTQLTASLSDANVDAVDMLVDGQILVADPVAVRSTTIDSRALVRTADAFGFASGSTVEEIPGLSDAILQTSATDIEVNADRTDAAVRDASGRVLRVTSDGEIQPLDSGSGLVAPSIDPQGYVWTVPSSSPTAVVAFAPDGSVVDIPGGWSGAAEVLAQRVSRDGTRLAVVARTGAGYAVWTAGILRDRNGVPTGLGAERKVLAVLPGAASALNWIDASTVAVLTDQDGDGYLSSQAVGGFGSLSRTPDGVVALSGGTQSGGIRLRDADGELYGQRNSNWQHLASGIAVLAIQQGSPG